VVATFCGHRVGSEEILDLFILWRGQPGWFQRRGSGGVGGGGSRRFGAGTKGRVSQHATYGDVTISFDADFDANTVTILNVLVPLDKVNTVLVDGIAEPDVRSISRTLWIEPRLPLTADMNLMVVRRSRELRDYLQCDIPMPSPMNPSLPNVPVITVCEKLKSK